MVPYFLDHVLTRRKV